MLYSIAAFNQQHISVTVLLLRYSVFVDGCSVIIQNITRIRPPRISQEPGVKAIYIASYVNVYKFPSHFSYAQIVFHYHPFSLVHYKGVKLLQRAFENKRKFAALGRILSS